MSTPPPQPQSAQSGQTQIPPPRSLPITTHHCRFCANLLLATTRDLESLPRRLKAARDSPLILPLRTHTFPPASKLQDAVDDDEPSSVKHYTILLSSSSKDRKPTIIRRRDGFEKRFFLRCGRCKLIMGYFLDPVHFPSEADAMRSEEDGEREDRAVYLLPGALMETETMDDEQKMKRLDREWSTWFKQ
ncbi:hypothetical protein BJX61DRAFT_537039 [Aspergillus egyptiacus]|nr:hypothetical protein BJX61DRAFT_537039 [Aspergillus egyptiacus]